MPATHRLAIDPAKALADEAATGHNRWHEAIAPALEVEPGDTVILETRDALDGQLTPASTAADVGRVNLNVVHPLTGPVAVKGAKVAWSRARRARAAAGSALFWTVTCGWCVWRSCGVSQGSKRRARARRRRARASERSV